jgi:hypothetical protein
MKLYGAASTQTARNIIDHGFPGRPQVLVDDDKPTGEIIHVVELRDMPPRGLILSRTTEVTAESDGDDVTMSMTGGPVLADDPGDFVIQIDVPNDVAAPFEARFDPAPTGWPFREFWLSPEVANQYHDTLRVFDSDDGEEVRPDLVRKIDAAELTHSKSPRGATPGALSLSGALRCPPLTTRRGPAIRSSFTRLCGRSR